MKFNILESTTSTLPSYTTATASSSVTDFSQYYDPSTYWQSSYGQTASQTWPTYDTSATTQTDYAAYYQQQASAHIQQQNALAQSANGATAVSTAYSHQTEDLALVGERLNALF